MAETFDPAGRGPSAYAPKWVREAEARRARGEQIVAEHAFDDAVRPQTPDAEPAWMSGEMPRFIDPMSRVEPPRPADRPAPQRRSARRWPRDLLAIAPRMVAVAAAAGMALYVGSQVSVMHRLLAPPQRAGSTSVPEQTLAKARPSAASAAQASAAPASEGKADRQAERIDAAFAEATVPQPGGGAPPPSVTNAATPAAGLVPAASESAAPPAPPAPQAPSAAPAMQLDGAAIAGLKKRADELVAEGDIAAARVLLRRAAEAHDAGAALALAATYDPIALEKLGVRGTAGDVVLARQWYDKAREFGSGAAAPQAQEATQGDRH